MRVTGAPIPLFKMPILKPKRIPPKIRGRTPATYSNNAPNFKASVIGRMILSPLDLERKLALVGGDIFHGALRLNQLFSARPMLGYGDYRSPIKGVYMCGSGSHPGGGVTGIPGHNAAREIIKDRRWRRF